MFGGRGAAGKGKGGLGDAVGGKGDGKRPGAPDAGGGAGRSKSETSGGPTRSWAGDEDSWQHDHPLPSRFGELRALTAGAVDEIRKAQVLCLSPTEPFVLFPRVRVALQCNRRRPDAGTVRAEEAV